MSEINFPRKKGAAKIKDAKFRDLHKNLYFKFSVYYLDYTYEKKGSNFSSTRVLMPHRAELAPVTLAVLNYLKAN